MVQPNPKSLPMMTIFGPKINNKSKDTLSGADKNKNTSQEEEQPSIWNNFDKSIPVLRGLYCLNFRKYGVMRLFKNFSSSNRNSNI